MATHYVTLIENRVASTQDVARQNYDGSHSVLVIARHQDNGRGRSGRRWLAADDALFCSLATALPCEAAGLLSIHAGLAAQAATRRHAGVETRLKWPNDLLLEGTKVGGVLIETTGEVAIVGLGINLSWERPIEGATALQVASGGGLEVARRIAHSFADELMAGFNNWPGSVNLTSYRENCDTIGREVTWEPEGAGSAIDIDRDGGLMVEVDGAIQVLRSGEVTNVRTATIGPISANMTDDDLPR